MRKIWIACSVEQGEVGKGIIAVVNHCSEASLIILIAYVTA